MKRLGWPLPLSFLLILVYAVLRLIYPDWGGLKYLLAACLISLSIVFVRIVSFLLFDILFQKRKGREAPALLRFLVSIVVYIALFVLIFSVILERDVTGVLATSAVVSIIIGLALQDTLGNFFAGISLHIEQPYHIGDWIRLDSLQGKVIEVSWRTTKVRTNNNSTIILPNNMVARQPLEIYPYGNLNRRTMIFPAPYSVPPEKVIPLIREAVRTMPNVSPERIPVVRIAGFADSNIDYEVLYWVIDYMWTSDLDTKIRERIWYVFWRNSIEIPFPHRQILYTPAEPPASEDHQYEKILNGVELFDPLTDEEKAELARGVVRYLYAPGEMILRQGDAGSSMFIISRGKAEVQVPSSNGDKAVATLSPGDFFGEMALFTGERRTADVCAVDEVELFEIRKSSIELLLHHNEKLAEGFSRKIAERQAHLDEHASRSPEQKAETEEESILRRIKRFFSLK